MTGPRVQNWTKNYMRVPDAVGSFRSIGAVAREVIETAKLRNEEKTMTMAITPVLPMNPQELAPAQLCWLRDKVPSFADAHDAAEKAQIHAHKTFVDLFKGEAP